MILQVILLFSLYSIHVKSQVTDWNGNQEGGRVYFYTDTYQTGTGYVLDLGFLGQCFSINKNNPAGLQSLDTNGACVYLFCDPSCEFNGAWAKVRRYQYEANDLNVVGLAGEIQSVRSCAAFKIPVYLFPQPNFSGAPYRADVFARSGCTNILREQRKVRLSVYLNDPASCVILFTSINCRGMGIRVYTASRHARDLNLVDFDRVIRSVQSCAAGHSIHAKYSNSTSTTTTPAAPLEKEFVNDESIQEMHWRFPSQMQALNYTIIDTEPPFGPDN